MFIFWGTRTTEKKHGYVADFCPICRKITPFRISRFGTVGHFYGISMGRQKLLGHAGYCENCGTQIGVDATSYEAFEKESGNDVESLIRTTFPSIREARAARLALEEKVRAGTLDPEERRALLMEPFHLSSELTEATLSGETKIQGRGGWGCLSTVLVSLAVLFIGNAIWADPEEREKVLTVFTILLIGGGIVSLILLVLEPGRIFSRKIVPNLVAALKPLKPTKEELAACLDRFKRSGFKLGKKIKAERLWKAIHPDPAAFVAPDLRK